MVRSLCTRRLPFIFVIGMFIGCASTGSSAYSLSSVDVAPELRGCQGYSEPAAARGYGVEVRFVVDASGEVRPGTIEALPRRMVGRTHPEEMVRRATRDAAGCSFEPALLDGRPVPVTMRKRFYYPDEG